MFEIGAKVVYPMHGAGVIEGIEEKEILGEKQEYYILSMPIKNMKVMLPVKKVEDLGVRNVIGNVEVDHVFKVLSEAGSEMPDNWNRRYRDNMEKVKSGDVIEVARVVRNLLLMDKEKGLSTGERKMLANSQQILVSEIVLAKDMEINEVEQMIKGFIL